MSTEFRFITVNAIQKDILKTILDQAIRNGVNDLYEYIKKVLTQNQVAHKDEHRQHPSYLSWQGGYFSIYYDPMQRCWKFQNH
jgi:hypothetical protein